MIIVKWIIISAMVAPMVVDCFNGNARKRIGIFSRITVGMLAVNFLVISSVIATSIALHKVFPFLDWSWFALLGDKGTNVTVAPMKIPYIGVIFTAILIYNLPNMAYAEEDMFRNGLSTWMEALPWAVVFGMTHCIAGVPIYAGIALTISGLWFTSRYFSGGIELSATHHVAYNLIVVVFFGTVLLIG
jgi:hypothetical protein